MTLFTTIVFLTSLGTAFAPQRTTQDYLQDLIGQKLILRHYAGSANPKAKESDLTTKKGGCDEAVEVMKVAFDNSSVRLTLRSVGTPFIGKKSRGCATQPDMYSLRISDFALDQPSNQAEDAIGHILQTPEGYLSASGVTWSPQRPSGNELPVDFPGPV